MTFIATVSGTPARTRFRHRGVTVHHDRVFVTYRNFLYALDTKDGRPIASFGSGGRIDLREGLGRPAEGLSVSASTPGAIFEDLLILPASVPETLPGTPGHIRAFAPLRNIDAWYAAFGIKEGDPLYIAPEDRVRIW